MTDFSRGITLIKRMGQSAKLPKYGTDGAVAFDLFPVLSDSDPVSPEGVRFKVLEPGQMATVRTGWAIKPPRNWSLELHSRDGQGGVSARLANRAGLSGSDGQDEVLALLVNEGAAAYAIREDVAMCQGRLAYSLQANFFEVLEMPAARRRAGCLGAPENAVN